MKEAIRKRLKELTSIIGLSGYEWDVARYVKKELEGCVDSIEVMKNGMLVAAKKGKKPGPRVLISAVSSAVNYLNPDYGLFIDTVPAGDVPDCDYLRELPIGLGKGPVIILSQAYAGAMAYAVSHPKLVQGLRDSAVSTGSKHQEFAFINAAYVTDGARCLYAGNGMAIVSLAIPSRYSHSPVEVCNLNDAVDTLKITEDFLKKNIDLTMI